MPPFNYGPHVQLEYPPETRPAFRLKDGSTYVGEWVNDKIEGRGVMEGENGKYEGFWKKEMKYSLLFLFLGMVEGDLLTLMVVSMKESGLRIRLMGRVIFIPSMAAYIQALGKMIKNKKEEDNRVERGGERR